MAGYLTADPGSSLPRVAQPCSFLTDAISIAMGNVGGAVLLVLGVALTAGVSGIAMFGINGYVFGVALGSLSHDHHVLWVLVYAPLEVASFLVAAWVGYRIAEAAVAWLQAGKWSVDWRLLTRALAVAGIGLLVAAVLESYAIQEASGAR